MTKMNNNNISGIKNAAPKSTITTSSAVLSNVPEYFANKSQTNIANQTRERSSVWYHHHTPPQQQLGNSHTNSNNNIYNENVEREKQHNFWKSNDGTKTQQHNKRNDNNNCISNNSKANNNICDIIVVDIEDEEASLDEEQQHFVTPQKFIIDASMKYRQHILHDTEQVVDKVNNNNNNNDNDTGNANADNANNDDDDLNDDDEGDEDDDNDDSLASMETLSDNVSIWIDGEKHWVAGVDEQTTCSDLIWALLNYQNGQQHMFEKGDATEIDRVNVYEMNNHQQQQQLKQQQQHQPKAHHNMDKDNKCTSSSNGITTILYAADNKPNKYFSSDTINTSLTNTTTTTTSSNTITTHTSTTTSTTIASINQSMPIYTKEQQQQHRKLTQNLYPVAGKKSTVSSSSSSPSSTPAPVSPPQRCLPFAVTLPLPPGITTAAQLTTEYVIVKQYHHCEEYLDGSTKVFDVLPPRRDSLHKKECELLLRHLGPAPAAAMAAASAQFNNNAATPQLSSLISTDKDSGMGSPVGSARSAKFRRRKHKSSQWLAQANTLHPKLSRCTANERLMKIILAQDETIQRQLSLLRDKELQITKIEEEKHRKRERELGKNYLLETYLNGLDEAECEPEIQDGVEIFIDQPYQRCVPTTTGTTKFPEIRRTTEATTAAEHEIIQTKSVMAKNNLSKDIEIQRKEKKKKRNHKDKITKEDYRNVTTSITQITEIKSRTNKDKDRDRDRDKDKEKLTNRQELYHRNDLTVDTCDDNDSNNEPDITLKIQWLEKIYTLNKQLQKEEELTAKLNAKVRKHQLRKAQQTQMEVQMEIDKLDDNLALQCGDIRKIEANLMETNEQLQKKLYILERLSVDYLQEQQQQQHTSVDDDIINTQQQLKDNRDYQQNENRHLMGSSLKNSLDLQKLALSNLKSTEDVKQYHEIIAKPGLEINNPLKDNMIPKLATKNPLHPANQSQINEYFNANCEVLTNSVNAITLNPTNRQQHLNNVQDYHPQQLQQHQQQNLVITSSITLQPATIATTAVAVNMATAASLTTKTTMSTTSPCSMFIDKNMLSSLPVQNAKTIKKQMFHAQTSTMATATTATSTTSTTTASTTTMTTASPVIFSARAAAASLETLATNANKFPKQQFQHIIQHMPTAMATASTILTSRPQTSHQIPTTIVILKHPSALPTSSSALALSSVPVPAPPTSSSPTPSLMAMNTVDISQLGTLV